MFETERVCLFNSVEEGFESTEELRSSKKVKMEEQKDL